VPRSTIVVPSHRKAWKEPIGVPGDARHLPRIVDGTAKAGPASQQRAEVQHRRAVPQESVGLLIAD
jgi:hypothetical protein